MKTIKKVKGTNNKTYRVRKINNLNHFIIDTFVTKLDECKREVQGYSYVACADTEKELSEKLEILTK